MQWKPFLGGTLGGRGCGAPAWWLCPRARSGVAPRWGCPPARWPSAAVAQAPPQHPSPAWAWSGVPAPAAAPAPRRPASAPGLPCRSSAGARHKLLMPSCWVPLCSWPVSFPRERNRTRLTALTAPDLSLQRTVVQQQELSRASTSIVLRRRGWPCCPSCGRSRQGCCRGARAACGVSLPTACPPRSRTAGLPMACQAATAASASAAAPAMPLNLGCSPLATHTCWPSTLQEWPEPGAPLPPSPRVWDRSPPATPPRTAGAPGCCMYDGSVQAGSALRRGEVGCRPRFGGEGGKRLSAIGPGCHQCLAVLLVYFEHLPLYT